MTLKKQIIIDIDMISNVNEASILNHMIGYIHDIIEYVKYSSTKPYNNKICENYKTSTPVKIEIQTNIIDR
jgi:hypothetical protein